MPQLYGIRGIPKGKKKVHKSGSIAWYNKVEEEHQDDNGNTKKKGKQKGGRGVGERRHHSRATQSLLRETSSIELSVVQNRRSVALLPLQLF